MIKNISDLKYYRMRDAQRGTFKLSLKEYLFNDIWKFLRALRYAEYINNTKQGKLWSIYKLYTKYRLKSIGKKLGYSIPMNVFGPGLSLPHYGNIVVNYQAKIGENCKIHVGVNIGADYENGDKAPQLGDNCYIAPGAKIFGDITIGNGVKIGANAVVNKSFEKDNIVLIGIPARELKKTEAK